MRSYKTCYGSDNTGLEVMDKWTKTKITRQLKQKKHMKTWLDMSAIDLQTAICAARLGSQRSARGIFLFLLVISPQIVYFIPNLLFTIPTHQLTRPIPWQQTRASSESHDHIFFFLVHSEKKTEPCCCCYLYNHMESDTKKNSPLNCSTWLYPERIPRKLEEFSGSLGEEAWAALKAATSELNSGKRLPKNGAETVAE